MKRSQSGFTLIELLVVLAIIGLLAAMIVIALANSRAKARDAKRKQDMLQIGKALELYYNTNGTYPATTSGSLACAVVSGVTYYWLGLNDGSSPAHTTSGANSYIPNMTPTYLSVLPVDPKPSNASNSGYFYCSSGTNYKLIDNSVNIYGGGPESFPSVNQQFYEPSRPTTAWQVTNNAPATANW